MIRKPKKISTFDTRFIVWVVFALSIYHYGIKFILVDTQYILRTPYVVVAGFISQLTSFLPTKPQQNICPITKNNPLENHLPTSSVPVLQYFDTGYTRTLLIPKRNFNIGDIVVKDNYLIGRITKVGKQLASVQLITDPASFVPVVVENINGIASGIDSQKIKVNRLQTPPTTDLVKQPVYTSGIDGVYPKNLLVGFVKKFSRNDIQVINCLDFRKLNDVTVFSYGTLS